MFNQKYVEYAQCLMMTNVFLYKMDWIFSPINIEQCDHHSIYKVLVYEVVVMFEE